MQTIKKKHLHYTEDFCDFALVLAGTELIFFPVMAIFLDLA